jgi:hypothetical protein
LYQELSKDGELSQSDWMLLGENVVENFSINLLFGGFGEITDILKPGKELHLKKVEKVVEEAENVKKIEKTVNEASDVTKVAGDTAEDVGKVTKDANKIIVEVDGKRVILDSNTFDPNKIDSVGRTNIERMEQGLAPIGKDGKSVNLHHVDQTDAGPIKEITATEHQKNYKELHSNTGQEPSKIDRKEFGKWKKKYWPWRSEHLENY